MSYDPIIKRNDIVVALEDLSEFDLLFINNEIAYEYRDYEAVIYTVDDFDEVASGYSPSELADNVSDFSTNDEYFVNGIYGFRSFDYVSDEVDFYAMAEYIIENDEDFGYQVIRNALSDEDEEIA